MPDAIDGIPPTIELHINLYSGRLATIDLPSLILDSITFCGIPFNKPW